MAAAFEHVVPPQSRNARAGPWAAHSRRAKARGVHPPTSRTPRALSASGPAAAPGSAAAANLSISTRAAARPAHPGQKNMTRGLFVSGPSDLGLSVCDPAGEGAAAAAAAAPPPTVATSGGTPGEGGGGLRLHIFFVKQAKDGNSCRACWIH